MAYDAKKTFSNYRRHQSDKNIDDEMLRVVHKSNQVFWDSMKYRTQDLLI